MTRSADIKLVQLPTFKSEVDADVVAKIEVLLERAKNGEFIGFAYIGILRDSSCITSFSSTTDVHAMLGGAAMLQHRMAKKWDE